MDRTTKPTKARVIQLDEQRRVRAERRAAPLVDAQKRLDADDPNGALFKAPRQ